MVGNEVTRESFVTHSYEDCSEDCSKQQQQTDVYILELWTPPDLFHYFLCTSSYVNEKVTHIIYQEGGGCDRRIGCC